MTGQRTPVAGRQILLVEDNFLIADAMARALRERGAEIIGPAATVKDALALIAETQRIDGAALDVNLRGEMVYPVADALRAKGVRILLLTGYDTTSVKPGYEDVPSEQKPIAIERLIDVLSR